MYKLIWIWKPPSLQSMSKLSFQWKHLFITDYCKISSRINCCSPVRWYWVSQYYHLNAYAIMCVSLATWAKWCFHPYVMQCLILLNVKSAYKFYRLPIIEFVRTRYDITRKLLKIAYILKPLYSVSDLYLWHNDILPVRNDTIDSVLQTFGLRNELLVNALRSSNEI